MQASPKDLVIRFFSRFRCCLLVLEETTISSCILQAISLEGIDPFCESSHAWKMHSIESSASRERNHVKRRKRMRKQILFIHGAGNQHKPLGSGKLIASLQEQLGSDYQILAPDMPDPDHPRYFAWRNQIEQELNKLDADALLIGHSLGGSTLLKHLAEGTYQRPIAGLFLVAVPYWGKQDWELEYAVPDDFASHLPPIRHLFLYHSRSDEEVPFSSLLRYQEKLPQATVRVLEGKEHSFTEGLPALAQDIKRLEPRV
jgi:uncharacterized protein